MIDFAIFNYSGIGENQGGPRGYLYNLFIGFKEIGIDIPFFSITNNDINFNLPRKTSNPLIEELKSIIYIFIKGFICYRKVNKNIHKFKIIHVHSNEDVFYLRKFIRYKGKIILTSHRPQPLADESVTPIILRSKTKWRFFFLKLLYKYIEQYGYKKSNGFIFPSEGAMKIYNYFPGFSKHINNKPIRYVYTGVPMKQPDISVEQYRNKLNISISDKMLCYIGRHNYIKGYDLLTSLVHRLEENNIKVVCAGANNLLPSPISNNWIEMGYINDTYNLVNASDVVVIPNRSTYFDLIIIEALSLGKIIVTSDTGGNLDIAKQTKGVMLFKNGDKESLYDTIIKAFSLSNEEKESYINENILFYMNHCTVDKFACNYLRAIKSLNSFFNI